MYQQTYSRRKGERKHCISKRIQTQVREKTSYKETYSRLQGQRKYAINKLIVDARMSEIKLFTNTHTRLEEKKQCYKFFFNKVSRGARKYKYIPF